MLSLSYKANLHNFKSILIQNVKRNASIETSTEILDTIFSLSSGYGKCGVAVVRVSGPSSLHALKQIAQFADKPAPRYAYLKKLWHPKTGELIDRGLTLWFPGPRSFTGEDCCEFQVHGGPAILIALLNALSSIDGLRPAKAGEFTKRAFYAGKLDLTEVEGLSDLIHAETEMQRKQALLQSDGALSKLYTNWRHRLLKCIAHIEAYIDFSEDQNIEDNVLDMLQDDIHSLRNDIRNHLSDGRRGEIMRSGCRAVIIGAPNVGKSSLMNKICHQPVSIVTNIAGTTRDIIEKPFNIAGYPVLFADTAGLRNETNDLVESEGILRAHKYVKTADLVILVIDALMLKQSNFRLNECRAMYLNEIGIDSESIEKNKLLTVVNKIDLLNDEDQPKMQSTDGISYVSCLQDIPQAITMITSYLQKLCGIPSADSPNLSQQRHRHLLSECQEHLTYFNNYFVNDNCPDYAIAAQELRRALRALGQITGEVSTEEILDVIFKDFCIGK